MSIVFISDIHLSSDRPTLTDAFKKFIESQSSNATHIYILGDLFDLWIGDDDNTALSTEIKSILRKASNGGTKLFFQHGNKDFTLGKRFAHQTGMRLLPDEYLAHHMGHKALLMHGDSLCTDDIDYQKFRRKSRNPLYLWCLLKIPLLIRRKIASKWREDSTRAKLDKKNEIMDVTQTAVREKMLSHNIKCLIHGHTHRPNIHEYSFGKRIVLGDWSKLGWYLFLDEDGFDLRSFSLN